jgi:hypothetical protein
MRRYLAFLLLGDLDRHIADAQRNGIAPPKMPDGSPLNLKYGDGLTRAEASALREWGMKIPQLRQAFSNARHPSHAATRAYYDLVSYFEMEHPQLSNGEPAPWEGPPLPAPPDPNAENPFQHFTAEQAADLLEWGKTRPEYQGFYDGKHPHHADLVRETHLLMEIAQGAAGTSQSAPAPSAGEQGSGISADAQRRIDDAIRDPAYLNRKDPRHAQAVEAVQAAYAAAYTQPSAATSAPGGVPSSSAPPAKTSAQRIAEIQANPAYWSKSHPGHNEAVASMATALAEPAAASPSVPVSSAPAETKP